MSVAPPSKRANGSSLLELLVSIALMAVLATALGGLVSVTTYQALKARVDHKVRVLIDREVNFYTLVPYTELDSTPSKVMDPANPDFGYKTDPNALPTGATGVYDSFEGTSASPLYLYNPPGVTGLYNYTITRRVTIFSDHKEINLWMDWYSPSPNYSKLMSGDSRNGPNPAATNPNTVANSYVANTIYRYP